MINKTLGGKLIHSTFHLPNVVLLHIQLQTPVAVRPLNQIKIRIDTKGEMFFYCLYICFHYYFTKKNIE